MAIVRKSDPPPPRLILIRVNERLGVHPFLTESNVSGVYPPLGIAYIAAAAKAAGALVSIIDAHALNLSFENLENMIRRYRPDMVGITSTTFNWAVVMTLANRLKISMPDKIIFAGGPQMSLYPEQCLKAPGLDGVIIGEGEQPIARIVDHFRKQRTLAGIAGTIFKSKGKLVAGASQDCETNLDALPMPAVDLLPLHRYYALTLPRPFLSIVTSRGCPYKCTYCSQVYVGGKYREHSAQRVLAEIERGVQTFGAKEIIFFDETFTVNKKRISEICRGITDKGIKVSWNIRTRGDLLDESILQMMRKAGCHSIHVGIESGSPRIQKLMKKNLDLVKVARTLAAARNLGMETRGYFMLGFPGETLAEIIQTIQLSLDLPLDWASYTITTPHPGTDIYFDGMSRGLFGGDYWERYTLGEVDEAPAYFVSDEFNQNDLEELLRSAYRRFYLRPGIALKKLWSPRILRNAPETVRTLLEIRAMG